MIQMGLMSRLETRLIDFKISGHVPKLYDGRPDWNNGFGEIHSTGLTCEKCGWSECYFCEGYKKIVPCEFRFSFIDDITSEQNSKLEHLRRVTLYRISRISPTWRLIDALEFPRWLHEYPAFQPRQDVEMPAPIIIRIRETIVADNVENKDDFDDFEDDFGYDIEDDLD